MADQPAARDPTTTATEWRGGHVWCLVHETWWKLCPCPCQVSMTAPIDRAAIDATTPKRAAFLSAMTPAAKPAIFRDPGFLRWLPYQACVVCEKLGLRQQSTSDPAHTPRTRIHGDIALPLCRMHHDLEERLQPAAFWTKYRMDPLACFRALYARYQAECAACAF